MASGTISFFTEPGQGGDSDIRMTYCAFAISSMLDDWSGVDIPRAIEFISACRVRNIPKDSYTSPISLYPFYRRTRVDTDSPRIAKHKVCPRHVSNLRMPMLIRRRHDILRTGVFISSALVFLQSRRASYSKGTTSNHSMVSS